MKVVIRKVRFSVIVKLRDTGQIVQSCNSRSSPCSMFPPSPYSPPQPYSAAFVQLLHYSFPFHHQTLTLPLIHSFPTRPLSLKSASSTLDKSRTYHAHTPHKPAVPLDSVPRTTNTCQSVHLISLISHIRLYASYLNHLNYRRRHNHDLTYRA